MGWMNLATLLTLLRRYRVDPRTFTVYVDDTELPAPYPHRRHIRHDDEEDAEDIED